jgi:hypothetical protein
MKRVVTALAKAQRVAWRVQAFAAEEGASNKRPYGSMWDTRYHFLVKQLEGLDGFTTHHPPGASYDLALVNGRVLIPFRHSTKLNVPIAAARIGTEVPRKVSRDFGVKPSATLFDDFEGGVEEPADGVAVGEAAAAAAAENLPVIYIGYVVNADTDRLLAAWWGAPIALEEDGRLIWEPERLPVDIVEDSADNNSTRGGLASTGVSSRIPRFDEGDEPVLNVSPRPKAVPAPSPEIEPTSPSSEDGDE